MKTLILGGVRSGKSRLAKQLARTTGLPVTYIATAEARDEEMRAHRGTPGAPAEGWRVILNHVGRRPLERPLGLDVPHGFLHSICLVREQEVEPWQGLSRRTRRMIRAFLIALRFPASLPVRLQAPLHPSEPSASLPFYPLVELLVGGLLASIARLLGELSGYRAAAFRRAALLKRIGGTTGDTAGTLVELTEVAALVVVIIAGGAAA
jgi:hypothetical protein